MARPLCDRPGLDQHTAGTIDIGLVALNTPFGDVEAAIRLQPDGTQQIIQKSDAECEATVRAEWVDLMDWMHKSTRMGHLMHQQRVQIEGSLTVMSYAEGHIRWPKTPQDQTWSTQFLNTMKTYTHYRFSAEYLELMDQIEETTE